MESTINKKEIEKRLKRVFLERFKMDMDCFDQSIYSKNLLGHEIGMAPRDLVYLFFDIEREFNIVVPEEDIARERFSTFNNLVEIIEKQLV